MREALAEAGCVFCGVSVFRRAFGVLLTVVGMAFWMDVVLGVDAEPKTIAMFGFFHLVYGVVLGGFVGAGFLS